jgi:hypothetical protein
MLPFSYTSIRLIHDENVQEALERYRFDAAPKRNRQGLLHAFGKALARLTQQTGNEPEPAKRGTEVVIGVADQS